MKYAITILAAIGIIVIPAVFFVVKNNNRSSVEGVSVTKTQTPTATLMVKNYQTWANPPELTIDKNKNYQAVLKTDYGNIQIDLNTKDTPITSNNFIFLARNKFYDGTIFHRVIKGFMIQGGDPKGDGTGGPGYKFEDEKFVGEYTRGTVAMANSGPNTNGSQFFIMHQDYQLRKNYVIFGHVTSGIDVVDKIASAEVTQSFGGENSKPTSPVKIQSVEIIEK
jgi:cyclophilin family peptidyl-prolyl cis-trans isomerase